MSSGGRSGLASEHAYAAKMIRSAPLSLSYMCSIRSSRVDGCPIETASMIRHSLQMSSRLPFLAAPALKFILHDVQHHIGIFLRWVNHAYPPELMCVGIIEATFSPSSSSPASDGLD